MTTRVAARLTIRPFVHEDLPALTNFLTLALGEGPAGAQTSEFFRWKHLDNPFGRSLMMLACDGDEIVGLRAFMQWQFVADGRVVAAARAVDTTTHPRYRRMGIFSRLTTAAVEHLRSDGVALIFNTPNDKSLPGYLKLGWKVVGEIPVWLRVRRPLRVAASLAGRGVLRAAPEIMAPAAVAELGRADGVLDALLDSVPSGAQLATRRDLNYLRWRYGPHSGLGYRALVAERDGEATGLAVFRVRERGSAWETTISEFIARDVDSSRLLLRRVVGAARVDHHTCHFSEATTSTPGIRSGWVRATRGLVLVANQLDPELQPRPASLEAFSLSLGDVEVF